MWTGKGSKEPNFSILCVGCYFLISTIVTANHVQNFSHLLVIVISAEYCSECRITTTFAEEINNLFHNFNNKQGSCWSQCSQNPPLLLSSAHPGQRHRQWSSYSAKEGVEWSRVYPQSCLRKIQLLIPILSSVQWSIWEALSLSEQRSVFLVMGNGKASPVTGREGP
jgi:hypothetical protein